jgi:hypothetical protein
MGDEKPKDLPAKKEETAEPVAPPPPIRLDPTKTEKDEVKTEKDEVWSPWEAEIEGEKTVERKRRELADS